MNEPSLAFKTQGTTWIAHDLYVETLEALSSVLGEIKSIGYEVKNLREDDHRKKEGVSVERMEKEGWSLWFCHLNDIQHGKCNSCNSYISVKGIRSHGHLCENCGEVTYLDKPEGSRVRFQFVGDESWFRSLEMKVYLWDIVNADLYFYPEPIESGYSGVLKGDKAQEYLQEFKDKWEQVEYDGKVLYKVKYAKSSYRESISTISVSDVIGHYWNHKIVKLWEDKEYSEWSHDLPVPESFSIHEPWHWAPLSPSRTLHNKIIHAAGMVSDQGYYYQDGRAAFYDVHWQRMRTFVDKFTTLPVDEWDRRRFRNDGPGAIADIAKFCHYSPQITNAPNIGNTLVALGKTIEEKTLTQQEVEAAEEGLRDSVNPFRS